MKNVFMGFLCVLLTVCFIWGCSVSAEAGGLTREKAELARKYRVLQTLYNQARTEAEAREESHSADRKAWREAEARWEAALRQAQTETAEALRAAEEAMTPAAEDAPEETGIFAGSAPEGPQDAPAPEKAEDEAPEAAEAETEEERRPLE